MYDEMGEIKKGRWEPQEDEVLIKYVKEYGPKNWTSSNGAPIFRHVKFSADEERLVIELHRQFGNKWARIAKHLPGRTDNDVKNFWNNSQAFALHKVFTFEILGIGSEAGRGVGGREKGGSWSTGKTQHYRFTN